MDPTSVVVKALKVVEGDAVKSYENKLTVRAHGPHSTLRKGGGAGVCALTGPHLHTQHAPAHPLTHTAL